MINRFNCIINKGMAVNEDGPWIHYEDYAALEAKYSEAQRELVALRSQVRDASALVKQLHDVVATRPEEDGACAVSDQEQPTVSTSQIGLKNATDDEGWVIWMGGDNPVPGKYVDIIWRDKTISCDEFADHYDWQKSGIDSDIIAYRVVGEDEQKDGAWTVWLGGRNPVPGKNVEVKFRIGRIGVAKLSDLYRWTHVALDFDIVAYRVVKEG
ncbi:hypothetical protein AB9B63_15910 [Escherichia coli]